jgi:hypothetical protein
MKENLDVIGSAINPTSYGEHYNSFSLQMMLKM